MSKIPPALKKRCLEIMDRLMERPCAKLFLTPVDPVAEKLDNYYSIIKHPVDLSLIRNNLEEDKYSGVTNWANDMSYIWGNAEKLNGKDSPVYVLAAELRRAFRKEHKKLKGQRIQKWTKIVSSLKDKLDGTLDTPPDIVSPYAIISEMVNDSEPEDFNESELSNFISATTFLNTPQDLRKMASILKRHNPEIDLEKQKFCVDVNVLSTLALTELRDYATKRLADLKIPYPSN